jgi:chromosome segregation protein
MIIYCALAQYFFTSSANLSEFYIMDEVDAALDKKNSERLAELVKKYCAKAQYIIISHNDSVISKADTLFGISMDEHGVSKATGLKI